jgi:hypothetical protein
MQTYKVVVSGLEETGLRNIVILSNWVVGFVKKMVSLQI